MAGLECSEFDILLTFAFIRLSISDSVFGADLLEELAKSHTEAPYVVVKCVEEIEKACSHHGMYYYNRFLVLSNSKGSNWGITVFKIFIWGGVSLDIWSEIKFYGNARAEP